MLIAGHLLQQVKLTNHAVSQSHLQKG
jgi:hypothetical protein